MCGVQRGMQRKRGRRSASEGRSGRDLQYKASGTEMKERVLIKRKSTVSRPSVPWRRCNDGSRISSKVLENPRPCTNKARLGKAWVFRRLCAGSSALVCIGAKRGAPDGPPRWSHSMRDTPARPPLRGGSISCKLQRPGSSQLWIALPPGTTPSISITLLRSCPSLRTWNGRDGVAMQHSSSPPWGGDWGCPGPRRQHGST
jgi:hypothetical protein